MVNYQLGKIYKIVSNTNSDECYIGSTTKEYLSQRFGKHKSGYKHYKNNNCKKLTSYNLFDEFGIDNCSIILLERYPYDSKDELYARERYYIETMNCVNRIVVGRPRNEYLQKYKQENRPSILEKKKEYYENNKDKINEVIQCECGVSCTKINQIRHNKSLKHQTYLLSI